MRRALPRHTPVPDWEDFGWVAANLAPALVAFGLAMGADLLLAVTIGVRRALGVEDAGMPPAGTFIVTALIFVAESALVTSIFFLVFGRLYRKVRTMPVKLGVLAALLAPVAAIAAYGVLGVWVVAAGIAGGHLAWVGIGWPLHPLNYAASLLPLLVYLGLAYARLRSARPSPRRSLVG